MYLKYEKTNQVNTYGEERQQELWTLGTSGFLEGSANFLVFYFVLHGSASWINNSLRLVEKLSHSSPLQVLLLISFLPTAYSNQSITKWHLPRQTGFVDFYSRQILWYCTVNLAFQSFTPITFLIKGYYLNWGKKTPVSECSNIYLHIYLPIKCKTLHSHN